MLPRVISLLLLLFAGGCALHRVVAEDGAPATIGVDSLFANIRIERWGEQRFAGILMVQEKHGQLMFALLDATGLTLLEGVVPSSEDEDTKYKGVLQKTKLADFLGGALMRLFLQEPDGKPCSSYYFRKFCLEQHPEDDAHMDKTMVVGPFTLWRADIFANGDNYRKQYTYEQPWVGVRIVIGELKK